MPTRNRIATVIALSLPALLEPSQALSEAWPGWPANDSFPVKSMWSQS